MSEVASGSSGIGVSGMREDLLHHDPLLDCLVELTRIHVRVLEPRLSPDCRSKKVR